MSTSSSASSTKENGLLSPASQSPKVDDGVELQENSMNAINVQSKNHPAIGVVRKLPAGKRFRDHDSAREYLLETAMPQVLNIGDVLVGLDGVNVS
eukprot:11559083-Ditylum_brightwellii.AAC.1